MANEINLIPFSERSKSEARENGKKGGKASGEARRKSKTIRTILQEILKTKTADVGEFSKLAKKMGIEDTKSIKDTFALLCLLNGAKKGNLDELIKLSRLLGEDFLDDGERTEAEEFDLAIITPFERVNSSDEFGEISEEVEGDEGP